MSSSQSGPSGPDFTQGTAIDTLADGEMLAGHVGEYTVLLARRGNEFFAIGATCTHYSGPLAEGILVGDTVRCPWHHACFSLRTGEGLHAPAINPVACWTIEQRDGNVYVRDKIERPPRIRITPKAEPRKIVIVGGGAAGFAAAEMLRRQRYQGSIVMVSDDAAPPVDRPNLSKDYLAGTAPEEWVPMRDDGGGGAAEGAEVGNDSFQVADRGGNDLEDEGLHAADVVALEELTTMLPYSDA